MLKSIAAAVMAASVAWPVMAQTPAASPAALGAPANGGTGSTGGNYSAAEQSTISTDNNGLRASRIVGSAVYNDHNDKVGSVDDLVIGNDGSLNAIVSVGGFLGIGSKMVAVPFDKLQFDNAKGGGSGRVVMPGVTKESLNGMPSFHYVNRG